MTAADTGRAGESGRGGGPGRDFEGLVAAVTGGASGIGLATARLLRDRGARVAVLDLSGAHAGEGLLSVPCDVGDDDQVRAAVDRVASELGGLDVLVNNAGVSSVGTVEDNPDDEWAVVLDVNVVGVVRVTRAALPHLRASQAPAVVTTCSTVALVGVPKRALYSASKGALYGLTLAMAADHVRDGVRFNAVAPGTADTPWVARLLARADDPVAERAALEARQPMGRLVSADEVAHAIAYLASPLSGSTTGTVLTVDGGMSGLRLPH
jgi:NAD(P)-dependent dehydrogenase (short-subunit alcohol dehydrogenase family)